MVTDPLVSNVPMTRLCFSKRLLSEKPRIECNYKDKIKIFKSAIHSLDTCVRKTPKCTAIIDKQLSTRSPLTTGTSSL